MSIFDTILTETEAPETVADPGDGAGGSAAPTGQGEKNRRRRIIAFIVVLALIALVGAVAGWYLHNRKPLTQLPGLEVATLPHYERSLYGATEPLGVAVSATGDRVYVTESGISAAVHMYDGKGKETGTFETPPQADGAKAGTMHQAVYLAVDPVSSEVYVTDRLAQAIYVYQADGTFDRTFAKPKDVGSWSPLAIGFAPNGTLYVTDVRGKDATKHRVLVFGTDGSLLREIGKPGDLNYPNGVWADNAGTVRVSDSNNGRLVTYDPKGEIVNQISRGMGEGDLGMPRGVGVDDSGRLFVVDTTDHMVRVYTLGATAPDVPTFVGSFGGEGRLDGTFEYPNGLALDTRAHIYVTDRLNNRVQVWGY